MPRLRVLVVIGTRPEAIKLARVVHHLRQRGDRFETIVALTGQHRELIEPLSEYFDLRPDVDLKLMTAGQSPAAFTAAALAAISDLLAERRPDWLVIQGDTATVLAAAVAGFLNRCRVLHVEAGLRSGTLDEPWPEEFNRRVATLAATRHAAPTTHAAEQLMREAVAPTNVRVTGNPVIDTLLWTTQREQGRPDHWRRRYEMLGDATLALVTAHRRENLGARLQQIAECVRQLAQAAPRLHVLWPVHPNPAVRQPVVERLQGLKNVHLVEPVAYPEFVWLMNRASLLLTDSGGIQEEAPSLGKPALVLRDVTERPEALATGWVELVGVDPARVVPAALAWLRGGPIADVTTGTCLTVTSDTCRPQKGAPTASRDIVNPFGDGKAAERIVDWLADET